jgi:hypothetical protein
MRGVCMVGRLLVVPGIVVFAGFCVVLSSMCGVFCCLLVVLGCFLGHGVFPLLVWLPLAGLTPSGNSETRVSAKRSCVTSPRGSPYGLPLSDSGKFAGSGCGSGGLTAVRDRPEAANGGFETSGQVKSLNSDPFALRR